MAEEACAAAADLRLIGSQYFLHLDDRDNVIDGELQARFAAALELHPWDAQFEIGARRLVHLNEIASIIGMWWHPGMLQRILEGAAKAWRASSREGHVDA